MELGELDRNRRPRAGISRRRMLAGVITLAGSAALAACGPEAANAPGGQGAPGGTAGAGTSGTPAAGNAPAAPADQQGLHLNLGAEPDSVDPQKASFIGEIACIMRVFSNLLTFDDKSNLVPEMAEKMPAVSPDGKVLTFTLKQGLKYSDGKPLTAKDFEFGWKRHLDPRTLGEYAFTGFIIEGAEEFNSSKETDPAKL